MPDQLRARHRPRDVLATWRAHPGLGRAYGGVTFLGLALGAHLVTGSPKRFVAGGFTTIREVGGTTVWGAILLAAAVLLLAAIALGPFAVQAALFAGALIHGLLAVWFFTASLSPADASFFGAIYSAVMCWWHISQALEYSASQR